MKHNITLNITNLKQGITTIEVLSSDTLDLMYVVKYYIEKHHFPKEEAEKIASQYKFFNNETATLLNQNTQEVFVFNDTYTSIKEDWKRRILRLAPDVQAKFLRTTHNNYDVTFSEEQRQYYQAGLAQILKAYPADVELKMLYEMTRDLHEDQVKLCPNPWDEMQHGFAL